MFGSREIAWYFYVLFEDLHLSTTADNSNCCKNRALMLISPSAPDTVDERTKILVRNTIGKLLVTSKFVPCLLPCSFTSSLETSATAKRNKRRHDLEDRYSNSDCLKIDIARIEVQFTKSLPRV